MPVMRAIHGLWLPNRLAHAVSGISALGYGNSDLLSDFRFHFYGISRSEIEVIGISPGDRTIGVQYQPHGEFVPCRPLGLVKAATKTITFARREPLRRVSV